MFDFFIEAARFGGEAVRRTPEPPDPVLSSPLTGGGAGAGRAESPMDIRSILSERRFRTVFDPVVSIKQRAVVGVKARALPVDAALSPEGLHEAALREGLSVEMDRALRQSALEGLQRLPRTPGLLLFLGFDAAIVDQGVVGSGRLLAQAQEAGFSPQDIVIDILESGARDQEALKKFIDTYRGHGFLISLSDVGAGHSNLGRVALARPDILKIGGSVVRGIDREPAKQEIFKALMGLSHKIGALVVAADVGREEEALTVLEMGVDMVEGPLWGPFGPDAQGLMEHVGRLAASFKTYAVDKNKQRAAAAREQDRVMSGLLKDLAGAPVESLDGKLAEMAKANPAIECLFILNGNGAQITDTVWTPGRKVNPNGLFRPARKGADHSLKDYYYLLMDAFVNRFRTEPYISQASGTLCVTLSGLFRDAKNDNHVLCMDVPIS
jgi:EAL domain-containing protein (putative c-di-GMP-specific phosphodiesterase class I)